MEQKILAHMNQDHKLALEDYLEVYGSVKITKNISNIKMKAIDEKNLALSFNYKDVDFEIEKIIPLEPPMENLASEARPRLVAMAKEAAEKRGYSHVQIKRVLYPSKPQEYVLLMSVASLVIAFFKPVWFYQTFLGNWLHVDPSGPIVSFLQKCTETIFYGTVIIHLAEIVFIMLPLLNKYRVPADAKLEWLVATAFEGFMAIKRFKTLLPQNH